MTDHSKQYDFTCEYAKSSRSGCKQCSNTIEQDTLRVGKMIQSPSFDGRYPVWYHVNCFFKPADKRGLNSWDQLHGKEKLRPDDMVRVKGLVTGISASPVLAAAAVAATVAPVTERPAAKAKASKKRRRKNDDDDEDDEEDDDEGDDEDADDEEDEEDDGKRKKRGKTVTKSKKPPAKRLRKGESQATIAAAPVEATQAMGIDDPEIAAAAALWKNREGIASLDNGRLREFLELNDQSTVGNEVRLRDRLADAMTYGPLPRCPDCKTGHVVVSGAVFKCTGHANEWARCQYETTSVDTLIKPLVLPSWAADFAFLKAYVFKPVRRILAEVKSSPVAPATSAIAAATTTAAAPAAAIEPASATPLQGEVVALSGKLSQTQAALKTLITKLGGSVVSSITKTTTMVISNDADVAAKSSKIQAAVAAGLPVLKESFLGDSESKQKILFRDSYHLAGPKPAAAAAAPAAVTAGSSSSSLVAATTTTTAAAAAAAPAPAKVKIVMKGRAAVDPLAGDDIIRDYHVLDDGGEELFDVVLNKTDITTGENSYYGLQVLEHDKSSVFKLFRKWGRIGTESGGKKLEDFHSGKRAAIAAFEKLFEEKTGNSWDAQKKKKFTKVAGRMYPIEIDYKKAEADSQANNSLANTARQLATSTGSTLPGPVQELIKLIFDLKMMEKSLAEMEIDLNKMPLGNLSKNHIKRGYQVLVEIETALKDTKANEKTKATLLLGLTNQFYTLIPHDFGHSKPKLIDSTAELKQKMSLMEALIDIEVATSLMKQSGGGEAEGRSVIDQNYDKLKCKIVPVDKATEEYKMIEKYVKNTHEKETPKIIDVFRIDREGEEERYDKGGKSLGNRQLLWHGSRLTNFVGIVSQGLRIAPPEAPVSGYRFGKGLYFADMMSLSSRYCRTQRRDEHFCMLLADVAMGKEAEVPRDTYMEKPLAGFDSTLALGTVNPDPADKAVVNNVTVPFGKIVKNGRKNVSCYENQMIIYNVNQCCLKYLLRVSMD